MLVLTRKVDESIQIGDEITVTVVRIGPGAARIGIKAPAHMSIVRGELAGGQDATSGATIYVEAVPAA